MKLPSNYYSPISGSLKSIVRKKRPVIDPVSSSVQRFVVWTAGSKKIIKYNDYCQFGREERINYIYFASKGNKPTLPSWFCGALGTSLGCLEVWSSIPAGATHLQIFFPCVESESVQPVPILITPHVWTVFAQNQTGPGTSPDGIAGPVWLFVLCSKVQIDLSSRELIMD